MPFSLFISSVPLHDVACDGDGGDDGVKVIILYGAKPRSVKRKRDPTNLI